jgi:hypothetical protein
VPTTMIKTVASAPKGRRNRSGIRSTTLTTVLFHVQEMAWVTGLMDTWNVTRRIVTQIQSREGISQPRSSR